MQKPRNFPYEHKVSGIVFRIYSAPQVKKQADGTQTEYESYLVRYYEGGNRTSIRKPSWEDVETLVEEVVAAVRQNDPERLELTGRDRRIYLAALEAVNGLGVEVDQAARDYAMSARLVASLNLTVPQAAQLIADCLTRLGKIPISTAIDFYLRHGATMIATKSVPEVVKELLGHLEKDQRGHYHIRDMKIRLGRFAMSFTGPISEVRERAISEWLQNLTEKVFEHGKWVENGTGKLVSKRTRKNYRSAICELFEFAKKRAYVPKDLPTEASTTNQVKVVPGKNHIITPAEARALLTGLLPHLIPFTVLKLFSGLRTEEAYGLHWEELKHSSRALIIEAKVAKLRQRRVPPILPSLAKWLRPFQGLKGPINPDYSSPNAIQQAVTRESRRSGVTLKRNTFRNCYISYRVAQPTAPAIVASETGTSVRMIESNYKELATKGEAKAWFSIPPSKHQLIALKRFVKELRRQQAD